MRGEREAVRVKSEDEENGAGGRNGSDCGEPEGETQERVGIRKKGREAKLRGEGKKA